MNNYEDYEQGWITNDGVRQESGGSTVMPDKIIGIWSALKLKDIETPSYHEIFLNEYKKSEKGSWGERPLAMLQRLMRIQAYKLVCRETDLSSIGDEIFTLPELLEDTTRKLQLWKCQSCGHDFYTPLEPKDIWHRRLRQRALRLVGRPAYIRCQVCSETKARKVKVVTKKIRE